MSIRVEGCERADQARAFVEGLADFLKVCILYPRSNARVQETADSLIRRQQQLLTAYGKLPLLYDGDRFRLGNTEVESEKENVAWLAKCCQKTHLAGLYFEETLKNDSLFSLAEALHRGIAVSSTATTFKEFWPEEFEGIRLLEIRFRGSFGEFGGGHVGDLAGELLSGLDPTSPQAELTSVLLENDQELMKRMRLLSEVVRDKRERTPHSTSSDGIHPLRVIIDNLPLLAFEDLDTGASKVKDVLDQVIEYLAGDAGKQGSESLEALTRQITTRAFHGSREVPGDQAVPDAVPLGLEEPDEVAREMEILLSEIQKLPDQLPAELSQAALDAPAEKLGIVLHQFVQEDSREARERLGSLALGYLESPAKAELAVLNQFLHLLCSPRIKPETQMRIAEFAQVLQGSKSARLLTQFQRFSKQALLDSFPASFGLFVDSIDISDQKERQKIGILCKVIGVEKIRAHKEFLGTRPGILAPARIKKILALASREVLPLVQIILDCDRHVETSAIVKFLSSLDLKGPETAALRTVAPADRLPREYLSGLCDLCVGSYPASLCRTSEMLIHRFVREPARSPAQIDQQAQAIIALGEFPTRETKELLRNLTRGTGLLGLKKAPRPIIQAAKIALQMFGGR